MYSVNAKAPKPVVSPKGKSRQVYGEGVEENVKKASGDSLASFLRLWWSAIEDQLQASALVGGGDFSVTSKLITSLRGRVSFPDPFNKTRLMFDEEEPHVQIAMSLKDDEVGYLKLLIFAFNEGRIVKKKELILDILDMRAEELADRIFDFAMELFESIES